jgi:hypothetical protein
MSTKNKLSVYLGLRDKTEKTFGASIDDMLTKFKGNQGLFQGYKKTYVSKDGYADDPTKRGYKRVASTVAEQLTWLRDTVKDHLRITLSIEKTNAKGVYADLVVDGTNWGSYSTLELLRLKTVLDGKIRELLKEIPVRKESVIWTPTKEENHTGRDIFESPLDAGTTKTTLKETKVVNDPHIKDSPNRPPVTEVVTTQVETGDYTTQDFSGEHSMLQRAEILKRYDVLYTAVIKALAEANDAEVEESDLGEKAFAFILK